MVFSTNHELPRASEWACCCCSEWPVVFLVFLGKIFGLALRKPVRVSCLFCLFPFPSLCFLFLFIVDSLFSLFCRVLLLLFVSCVFLASPFYHCLSRFPCFLILQFCSPCDPSVFSSGFHVSMCIWLQLFFFFWVFHGLYCCVPRPFRTHWLPISCFPFPVLCGWAENRQSVVSSRHVAVRTLSFHRGE